uniref:TetR/AcrR family transcriptional regulator n=1 Tax=Rhodococcus qingshengii TaxID=334542 RepID=UPI001C4DF80C|nr:TetR/AcrR family transcriptional regulator [Rhodococcus qingshengii]
MVRRADPTVRAALLDSAARVLAEEGPDALSTRRVAAGANTSSMAVYTHFGSIDGLISSVIEEGFTRLASELRAVGITDDPVCDLIALLLVNVEYARREPSLYQAVFVTAALGQYRRTAPAEMLVGRGDTFQLVIDACIRARAAERFDLNGSPDAAAYQWWSMAHGYVLLEVAGFVDPGPGTAAVLIPMLETMAHGLGDTRSRAQSSTARAVLLTSSVGRQPTAT